MRKAVLSEHNENLRSEPPPHEEEDEEKKEGEINRPTCDSRTRPSAGASGTRSLYGVLSAASTKPGINSPLASPRAPPIMSRI